jgi:Restriction endonuclease fold toxin 5
MGAAAIPPLVAAVDWLLVALGVTAAAGGAAVVSEEVKRRQRAASEAGTGAAAQTATQTRTKTCEKCPPDCGAMERAPHAMNEAPRAYQARVTGFPPYYEWLYRTIWFDGFSSADCHLKEAKGNYDQFLERDATGRLKPVFFFADFELKWPDQAERQSATTLASPPARLTWYLQGPLAYEYMARKLMTFPPLAVVLFP